MARRLRAMAVDNKIRVPIFIEAGLLPSKAHGGQRKQRPSQRTIDMKPILKWQYEQIIKELLLLQEHQADPTCPCETGGEMCTRKHLLAVEAYIEETLPMEEDERYRLELMQLGKEAKELREAEEANLRGEETEYPYDILEWPRNWRKKFEGRTLE
jgi:hypothetical protein